MKTQRIVALVTVELKKVYRDPMTLAVLLLMPVGLALLFYVALGKVSNARDYYPVPGMTHFEYLLPGVMGYAVIYMGMMVALAHVADVVDSNGKKDVGFDAGGIFHDSCGCENTCV